MNREQFQQEFKVGDKFSVHAQDHAELSMCEGQVWVLQEFRDTYAIFYKADEKTRDCVADYDMIPEVFVPVK